MNTQADKAVTTETAPVRPQPYKGKHRAHVVTVADLLELLKPVNQ